MISITNHITEDGKIPLMFKASKCCTTELGGRNPLITKLKINLEEHISMYLQISFYNIPDMFITAIFSVTKTTK
jgi:hypothetical protein